MLWPSRLYTCGVWRSSTRAPFQYIVVTLVVRRKTNATCTHVAACQREEKPVVLL